jgi:Cu(I)/Ag(I) efflux system membrane protein CusA/SilA
VAVNYGGFVAEANRRFEQQLKLPSNYSFQWSGEYEFELRVKERLKLILPIVFFVIFVLLYLVFIPWQRRWC